MRKALLLSGAAALALGAGPALADVDLDVQVFKKKDISVEEDITITKNVDVFVDVIIDATKAAEADTGINQANHNNAACGNCAEKFDWISNSVNGNSGLVSVNQAAGNMNNQGNAVTVAVDLRDSVPPPPPPPDPGDPSTGLGGFANAQTAVDQRNGVIKVPAVDTSDGSIIGFGRNEAGNTVDSVNIIFREARITGSINENTGVVHVNQATGHMANQANALTAAISLEGGVALAESDLGQENSNNQVHERRASKTADIRGSVQGNAGVVGVNQSSGNMANQANLVTLGAAAMTLGAN